MIRAGVLVAAAFAAVVTSAPPAGASGVETDVSRHPGPASAKVADTVIGTGTPSSCTSAKVVRAVARGGLIRFSCGPDPVTITLERTAKVVNTSSRVVLDGDGRVTLSGGGVRRILYMNTCDRAQVWTTSHCNDQESPRLVVRQMGFSDGNATGETTDGGGGGAIFVRGGRLKVVDSQFARNRCDRTGPDLGGGAVRVLDQYADRPVVVRAPVRRRPVQQRLGAEQHRRLVGHRRLDVHRQQGRGPRSQPRAFRHAGRRLGRRHLHGRRRHPPGAGGLDPHRQPAREGGGAIFFVSNDRSGTLTIRGSRLVDNPSDGFETLPGIFFLGASRTITDSVVR